MKTLLTIGSTAFVAPDMQTAGKIADLLNKLQPVNRDYRNSAKNVLVMGRSREHELGIQTISDSTVIVKTIKDALKLRDAKDGQETQLL